MSAPRRRVKHYTCRISKRISLHPSGVLRIRRVIATCMRCRTVFWSHGRWLQQITQYCFRLDVEFRLEIGNNLENDFQLKVVLQIPEACNTLHLSYFDTNSQTSPRGCWGIGRGIATCMRCRSAFCYHGRWQPEISQCCFRLDVEFR